MARLAGAVVLGYLAMALIVFGAFSLGYGLLGPEGAFRAGSYEVSPLWAGMTVGVGFIAAVAGGWIAVTFARRRAGPRVLAGIVVILGIAAAMPAVARHGEPSPAREAGIDATEAMSNARQPLWLALLNPLIGVGGVLLGGRMRRPIARVEVRR